MVLGLEESEPPMSIPTKTYGPEYLADLQAPEGGELPLLPHPLLIAGGGQAWYSTDQMLAYARAALAAQPQPGTVQWCTKCGEGVTPGMCRRKDQPAPAEGDDLPPLPEPWIRDLSATQLESRDHFAADQMRAYALAAIAAHVQPKETTPLAWVARASLDWLASPHHGPDAYVEAKLLKTGGAGDAPIYAGQALAPVDTKAVARVTVTDAGWAQLRVYGTVVRGEYGRDGFDILAALASEINSDAGTASPAVVDGPTDAERLDYLQQLGATVHLIPAGHDGNGQMLHSFCIGGLHRAVSRDIREAIDAAISLVPVQTTREQVDAAWFAHNECRDLPDSTSQPSVQGSQS